MRTSTAYFAGAGTVIVAIAAGLGGGLLIGNIVSSRTPPQEMNRLEQRMASQRSQAAPIAEPAQPSPIIAANAASPSTAPSQPVAQIASQPTPEPKSEPGNSPVAQNATAPSPTTASAPEPSQPEARRQIVRTSEDSWARSSDADVRRAERRREHGRQWSERRRNRQDRELIEVEQAVRDDTDQPRRAFAAEPMRNGMPVIKLFGEE